MTVHMFRVVCDKPDSIGETQANQIVNQWLADNTPWTDDPTPHEITLVENTPISDPPTHFRGDVRFEFTDDKPALFEQIETDLNGIASWYRIGYHECDHDEETGSGCAWDETREGGNVPDSMPTFERY